MLLDQIQHVLEGLFGKTKNNEFYTIFLATNNNYYVSTLLRESKYLDAAIIYSNYSSIFVKQVFN